MKTADTSITKGTVIETLELTGSGRYDGTYRKEGSALPGTSISEWQRLVHDLAIEKGWWDEFPLDDDCVREVNTRDVMSFLANAHGEISEANEEVRKYPIEQLRVIRYRDDGKPEGFATEIADTIIRLLDTAAALGIDVEETMAIKHAYNATRQHRHGGKRA